MSTEHRPGRRDIIRAGVAGGVALVTFPLGCGPAAEVPRGPVAAGNAADVPADSLVRIGSTLFVGRDPGGLYAMSAICTHSGCLVSPPTTPGGNAVCPCHGSQFNRNGGVVQGPAPRSLQHYHVDIDADGQITIHGDQPVGPDDRTAG
jgi:Rieske Fe-S protein